MIRRPSRSTPLYSSAASDVYKRQPYKYCLIRFCCPFAKVIKSADNDAFCLLFCDPSGICAFNAGDSICFWLFDPFFDYCPENCLNRRELFWPLVLVGDQCGIQVVEEIYIYALLFCRMGKPYHCKHAFISVGAVY